MYGVGVRLEIQVVLSHPYIYMETKKEGGKRIKEGGKRTTPKTSALSSAVTVGSYHATL